MKQKSKAYALEGFVVRSRGRNLLRKKILVLLFIGLLAGTAFGTASAKAQGREGGETAALQNLRKDGKVPETGDETQIKVYLAIAAAAGSGFLLLYLSDHGDSMTEEAKKKRVEKWTGWAQKGGKVRRTIAIAMIFLVLLYYHAIGKEPEKKDKKGPDC